MPGNILFANCSERRNPVRLLGTGVDSRPRPPPARVPGEMEWLVARLSYLLRVRGSCEGQGLVLAASLSFWPS